VRKGKRRVYKSVSISDVQKGIGVNVCKQLLVIHAIGGCDTTSALFGVGKATVYRRVMQNKQFEDSVSLLQNIEADEEAIAKAGLKLMVGLYDGKTTDNLNTMRFNAYSRMVTSSLGQLMPQKLPPTERAAYYHVLRCHYQAVVWARLSYEGIDPLRWGSKLKGGKLEPVMTDQKVAPDNLLKLVTCKCKGSCHTAACTCRKHDMNCLSSCKNCKGVLCSNCGSRVSDENNEASNADDEANVEGDILYDWDINDVDYITEEAIEMICYEDRQVTMVFVICNACLHNCTLKKFLCL
jgi:hypothetical protein